MLAIDRRRPSPAVRSSETACACTTTRLIPVSSSARWRLAAISGGLALAAPEAIRLLDAVGKPWVLVETVGVGQVEVEIAGEADTTIVVVNPGWGDAVQANKAGLLEIGDVFVINKADRAGVAETRRDLEQMLDLSAPVDWRPPIIATVAARNEGIGDLWDSVLAHRRPLDRDRRAREAP